MENTIFIFRSEYIFTDLVAFGKQCQLKVLTFLKINKKILAKTKGTKVNP